MSTHDTVDAKTPTATLQVDVAIIGAGTAGLSARRAAKKSGASVVMIEDGPYGTTCARVGCMPSKLLIAAADVAHEIRHGSRFGVHAPGGPQVDGKAVLERVRRERDRFVGFVLSDVEAIPSAEKLRGTAHFVSPGVLQVEDAEAGHVVRVEAKAVVLATGSETWYPPVVGGAGDRLLRNDDVFELTDLPASLAVIGTGIIGLELGQALHRLGTRVSFFSLLPALGPATDPVIQAKAREVFDAELTLHLPVQVTAVERGEADVVVRWQEADGATHSEHFDWVLAATGRRPRLRGLHLERAGIELDARGLPIFDSETMQCGDAPVFIAGDATNDRPLLHEAADEGHAAGANAAVFPAVTRHPRRTPLAIVFIDPNMAMCGESFASLEARGADFAVGEVSYSNQGRARVMGRNAGHVRIYGERGSGRLLGAEMLGPRVENTSHLLAWAIQAEMTVQDALSMPFYHPVVEEGIRTGLRELAANLRTAR